MNKPIRVAQIIGVACNGGVEAVIMNYYKSIDKTKVQFDFFVESESKIINKEEIERMGGKVIIIPPYKKLSKYNKELKKIFLENNYDIVHSNMNTLSVFPLRIAKKCGVKTRIAHSHSTSNKKEWKRNIIKNILRPFSKMYATHYFACTEHAAKYLFGNKTYKEGKVTIINNAIDVKKYKFDDQARTLIRENLNISNKFVVGHIGRFMQQKNHDFLLDIFNEIVKIRKDSVLLLVGDGPLELQIKEKVNKLNLQDKVIFYGTTDNTAPLYSVMDCFAFPSLYEGLGMVAVESQMCGTFCVCSTAIPEDAIISKGIVRLSLDDKVDNWANAILSAEGREKVIVNEEHDYDIYQESEKLVNIYLELK